MLFGDDEIDVRNFLSVFQLIYKISTKRNLPLIYIKLMKKYIVIPVSSEKNSFKQQLLVLSLQVGSGCVEGQHRILLTA